MGELARVFLLFLLGLLPACAGDTARDQSKTSGSIASSDANRAVCRAALLALAEGRLETFRGLHACTVKDADAALGAAENAPGSLHPWGKARRYRERLATPVGVEVVVQGELIVAIEIFRPVLERSLRASLGEPEKRIESGLSSDWEQWVYAGRGLTAHVDGRGAVMAVYAYEPMGTAEFLRSSIADVHVTEHLLDR